LATIDESIFRIDFMESSENLKLKIEMWSQHAKPEKSQ
jgi:hypothetical protein